VLSRIIISGFWVILLNHTAGGVAAQQPVIISYVGGYRGNLVHTEKIEAGKLTHLLYAFANVNRHGEAVLNYPETDPVNLARLVALKEKNPGLKVLLSVGGLGWSIHFSAMALTAAGRDRFSKTCVELLRKYKLDGIDLDWEFPGYPGEGSNPYRPDDKQNFTLLCQSLRESFDKEEQHSGRKFLLTAAVDGWSSHFLPHTEMQKVQSYLDYICLMTYNFNSENLAGGHYLYSPAGWRAEGSVDGAVKAFIAAGVPASKLVAGAGFFPAAMLMETSDPNDRHYHSKQVFRGGLAKLESLINKQGLIRYWDSVGHSPYLFNSQSRIRIAYEDSASVKSKCEYILSQKLAGIMYWDYFSDPDRKLLHTIFSVFGKHL
jgi:chitinase